jgi:hypothetical protein
MVVTDSYNATSCDALFLVCQIGGISASSVVCSSTDLRGNQWYNFWISVHKRNWFMGLSRRELVSFGLVMKFPSDLSCLNVHE